MKTVTTISISPVILKRAKEEAWKQKTSFSRLVEISLLDFIRSEEVERHES
jgi:hypothetical protein